eukprot:scaffold297_cov148-Chaetoceros_neogracile.AAC.2
MPMVLLLKVSDMHMMWFITGLSAPYVHEPFTSAPLSSPLHGNFSANMQDIDTPVEAPTLIELPGDVIKLYELMPPSQQQF